MGGGGMEIPALLQGAPRRLPGEEVFCETAIGSPPAWE